MDISGPISGTGGLIETGSGRATLSGTDSYTGSTIVSAGTLVINGANALPKGGSLTVGSFSTTLIVTPADWTATGLTLTLGSDENLHVYTTGTTTDAVTSRAPASVVNVQITAPTGYAANLTIDSTAGNPIPAGGLNYSGAGGLIKIGSGTATLSGTDTYTGGTIVSAGTLLINSAKALPKAGGLTVGNGSKFTVDSSDATSSAASDYSPVIASSTNMQRPAMRLSLRPLIRPATRA